MPSIFLSYRREDSAGHAGRLFDRLQERFGPENVFWDVSGSIAPGERFDDAIEQAVAACDALLVVIGYRWLEVRGEDGARRIDASDDFVRLEVSKALQRGVRVIPVLVHGASLPRAEDLPAPLKSLAHHQAVELTDSRWDYDVSRLLEGLGPARTGRRFRPSVRLLAAVVLAAGLGLAGLAWMVLPVTDATIPADPAPDRTAAGNAATRPAATGAPRVMVPAIEGVPLEVARQRLSDAGLGVGDLTFLTLGRHPPGTVYHQGSPAGARVRPGAAIDLYVEREKRPGIHQSGQVHLTDAQVFDLDSDPGFDRTAADLLYEAADPLNRLLQPLNGAGLSPVGREPVDRATCAARTFANDDITPRIDSHHCYRTNRGRVGLLRIDDVGAILQLSFDTWESEDAPAGTVRLRDGESYHFSSGTKGRFSGGDFYATIDENGAAQFYANNAGQQGLVDLGDLGATALEQVPLPDDGFYKFGVPAVTGHSYVAKARAGEEGRFVAFRVTRVSDTDLTLEYVYR